MNDKPQFANVANAALVIATLAWGIVYLRGSVQVARPPSPGAAAMAKNEHSHKVASRLWQDPFESFEPTTNQEAALATASLLGGASGLSIRSTNPPFALEVAPAPSTERSAPDDYPWNEIERRSHEPSAEISVFGVMLDGGPYAEDREVRLRLRYAVEMAMLVSEVGAEDRSHLSTNAVELTNNAPPSKFAYEWFQPDKDSDFTNNYMCVLWLNEYDFADDPIASLNALLAHIRPFTNHSTNVSFYLIGPRFSDTLLTFSVKTNALTNADILIKAAQSNCFHILSPEATVTATFANARDLSQTFRGFFHAPVFHNWIATDLRLSDLLAEELMNREWGAARNPSNVIAIIAEQDTYYGRHLADDWIASFTVHGVSAESNIWQFGYFRGLDGSKPATEKSREEPLTLDTTPEAAFQKVLQQQQSGEKADGDAQLDYVTRLGDLLHAKDNEMKNSTNRTHGRIIAVGLTGSDPYDKLYLLRQLRGRLPEAVFFTTDLDAPLWTSAQLNCTRNLLVASGYPLEPDTAKNSDPGLQEFPPFRDVYQSAVFQACVKAIDHGLYVRTNESDLDQDSKYLEGSLYKIGRHGPVKLSDPPSIVTASTEAGVGSMVAKMFKQLPRLPWKSCPLYGFLAALFIMWLSAGFGIWRHDDSQNPRTPREAEAQERRRGGFRHPLILGLIVGSICWVFVQLAQMVANHPGEEVWNFNSGTTIWFSECLRFAGFLLSALYLYFAYLRHTVHRKRLWMDYFCAETEASRTTWEENWKERKKKWRSYPNIFLAFLKTWASFPNDWFQNVWKQRPTKGKKWRGLWQQSKEEWGRVWEKARPEKPYTIAWWTPRFVESTVEGSRRPAVDTNALFDDFLHLGWWRRRFVRATYGAVFFFGISWVIMQLLHDAPTRLLIRGNLSHWVDAIVLMLEVGSFLLALFYTLDGACLTGRFLDCISRHPTAWPEWLLQQKGKERGIDGTYLDVWLDVDFAAVQTKETGPLMFGPLLILLVLIISRLSYFDSWTWPTGLVIILVTSFALAAASWRLVRRAAKAVRQHALKRLDAVILTVESSGDYDQAPNSAEIRRGRIRKQVCIDRLKALRQDVDEEDRGAYAPWFQDPTYIALFVPTGVTGILSIAIQFWLNR